MEKLCFLPATELSCLIREQELSPVELVTAVLDRIERLNPRLAAYITVTGELARRQAKASEERARRKHLLGPLDGIPYSLKDLEPTAGVRTTFGSRLFYDNVPAEDGAVAGRLRASGGVLLGKTNTPSFGHKDSCDNLLGPSCRNPWQLDRTSGGSSGGAAAAVAAGLGPVAHGTDGAGSIRIPSALCGVFGFKPSFGRVPCYPSADYWAARYHNGVIARTVRDAALLLSAMAGPDSRDPLTIDALPENYVATCDGDLQGLRVVWSADLGYANVDPEIRAIAEAAALRFADLGCTIDTRDPKWPDPRPYHKIIAEVAWAVRLGDHAVKHPECLESTLVRMIEKGRTLSAVEHARALLARSAFYDTVRQFFDTCDLLLTPQVGESAWSAEPVTTQELPETGHRHSWDDRLALALPFNLTGQPAASVPCGFTAEGLPVGLQIVGRWHADSTVLRAAACFEALQPWTKVKPSLL